MSETENREGRSAVLSHLCAFKAHGGKKDSKVDEQGKMWKRERGRGRRVREEGKGTKNKR